MEEHSSQGSSKGINATSFDLAEKKQLQPLQPASKDMDLISSPVVKERQAQSFHAASKDLDDISSPLTKEEQAYSFQPARVDAVDPSTPTKPPEAKKLDLQLSPTVIPSGTKRKFGFPGNSALSKQKTDSNAAQVDAIDPNTPTKPPEAKKLGLPLSPVVIPSGAKRKFEFPGNSSLSKQKAASSAVVEKRPMAEIIAGKRITPLSAVSPNQFLSMYAVRVTNRWHRIIEGRNGSFESVMLLLIDADGNEIQATFIDKNVDVLDKSLDIGNTYVLKHVKAVKHGRAYKLVPHDYIMHIEPFTKVIPIEDDDSIPWEKNHFVPFSELNLEKIPSNTVKQHPLIDVIGIVYRVESKSSAPKSRITLKLVDDSPAFLRLTVWGDLADTYNKNATVATMATHIVYASFVRLDEFNGELGASTSYYSSVKINPPTFNQTLLLQEWFANSSTKNMLHAMDVSATKKIDRPLAKLATIAEVVQFATREPLKAQYFAVQATLTSIRTDIAMYYTCCSSCFRNFSLVKNGGCTYCRTYQPEPLTRMKIKADAFDESRQACITFFGDDAEKVMGIDINQLFSVFSEPDGNDRINEIIQRQVNKIYHLQIRVSPDNHYYAAAGDLTCNSILQAP